ncbi:MAG: helix-turn-helix domain-containing protein [Pseudomonas sp.]|nr:helix-turn-helix domain-containing protein [Pseudomonas sp.]
MPELAHYQVFQTLSRSRAQLERSAAMGDGIAAAIWSNAHDATGYSTPGHHTIGCYLGGGLGTFRRDQPGLKGAPDKLCILPAEHQSAWVVNGELRFMHLYFDVEQFALSALRLLDKEPRELQLRERTFIDEPLQSARFRALTQLDWSEPAERLLCSSLANAILDHSLLSHSGRRFDLQVKGGLAAHQRKGLIDYIEQHLDQPLSIDQLAQSVALSPYHFARMFSASFGLPPHRYVLSRRLQRGAQLLRHSRLAVGEIALACGFASASHFSNRFRASFQATPGQYRLTLGS